MKEALRRNREELEATVKARTSEVVRVNAEYKTILDAAPFGVALLRTDPIIQRWNPEYERMIRYNPDELLGQPALLPEDQGGDWNALEESLRAGHPVLDYEVSRLRKDRSPFSATIWMTPLHDCQGDCVGLVGFMLDNTERNRREEERQMLVTLIERSPDLVAVADQLGRLTFINRAGRHLLGLAGGDDMSHINL